MPGTEKTSLASAVLLGVPGCPDDFQQGEEKQDIPRNNYCEKNPAGSVGKVLNNNGQMMSE